MLGRDLPTPDKETKTQMGDTVVDRERQEGRRGRGVEETLLEVILHGGEIPGVEDDLLPRRLAQEGAQHREQHVEHSEQKF
jgi:hypothetical protein